ncbi:hypothetical protein CJ030_MR3G018312 [Morella rubra]|uniref:Uncharacterized protein n=1 Tax=Morella rubra TaxID=262757 RepID=A0A6A1W8J7_9ROSI|nr:hypothetical protein CJ030_MR3G018312 [Morella rubra]
MNTVYKKHRNRMYQNYLVFNSKEEDITALISQDVLGRMDLKKLKALQLQHESEEKPYIEVEIFAKVLGMNSG